MMKNKKIIKSFSKRVTGIHIDSKPDPPQSDQYRIMNRVRSIQGTLHLNSWQGLPYIGQSRKLQSTALRTEDHMKAFCDNGMELVVEKGKRGGQDKKVKKIDKKKIKFWVNKHKTYKSNHWKKKMHPWNPKTRKKSLNPQHHLADHALHQYV